MRNLRNKMIKKFKINDRVRIKKDSKFYTQTHENGKIIRLEEYNWYDVEFDGGYTNKYPFTALEPVPHEIFKIGDRITWEKRQDNKFYKGLKGTVLQIAGGDDDPLLRVKWDKNVDGHNCYGLCKNGYGWEILSSKIRLVNQEKDSKKIKAKKARIIKEIKANKDFSKCFKNAKAIKKEVESWDESKILGWK